MRRVLENVATRASAAGVNLERSRNRCGVGRRLQLPLHIAEIAHVNRQPHDAQQNDQHQGYNDKCLPRFTVSLQRHALPRAVSTTFDATQGHKLVSGDSEMPGVGLEKTVSSTLSLFSNRDFSNRCCVTFRDARTWIRL